MAFGSFLLFSNFPGCALYGATFPLVIGASFRSTNIAGRTIGALTSLNTLGGISGSLRRLFYSFLPWVFSVAADCRSYQLYRRAGGGRSGARGFPGPDRAGVICVAFFVHLGLTFSVSIQFYSTASGS